MIFLNLRRSKIFKYSTNVTLILGIFLEDNSILDLEFLSRTYKEFRISNCIASDWDGKPVKLKIEFQAHFPDKIKSNPEDMTLKPEDMVRYNYGKNISITPHNNILENFSTDDNVKLYLEDGTEYFGAFHFHMTNDSGIMTGEAHTKDSKELFTKLKNTNELKSTKLKNKNLLKQRTYNG